MKLDTVKKSKKIVEKAEKATAKNSAHPLILGPRKNIIYPNNSSVQVHQLEQILKKQ